MKDIKQQSIHTQTVHAGIYDDVFGAIVPPIYQVSTFRFQDADHGASLFAGREKGYIYTRMANPTIEALENAVAVLEGGHKGLGCGSGMAAVSATFMTLLQAGDHVICSEAVYGPTNTLLRGVLSRFAISSDFIDTSDVANIRKYVTDKTRLIYLETPGNPTLLVSDIRAVSRLAKEIGAYLVVDNTFMSPVLQKPLDLGADVVLHSMTKFLNGHGDVVAGMIIVKDEEAYQRFRRTINQLGGTITPFNSFLVHRGIKTLAIRMERICQNAGAIASYLESHAQVEWVRFPGLPSHPQYDVHRKQAAGPGGVIAFGLKGGLQAGKALMNAVKIFALAVSLGGVESLIQHPAAMTHASMSKEDRLAAGISDGLVRISVGIENVDELIQDLDQGLRSR